MKDARADAIVERTGTGLVDALGVLGGKDQKHRGGAARSGARIRAAWPAKPALEVIRAVIDSAATRRLTQNVRTQSSGSCSLTSRISARRTRLLPRTGRSRARSASGPPPGFAATTSADHVEVDVGAVAGDDIAKVLLMSERQDGEVVQGIARSRLGPINHAGDLVTVDSRIPSGALVTRARAEPRWPGSGR